MGEQFAGPNLNNSIYIRNIDRINAVKDHLSDGKSRQILEQTVAYRCSLNPALHPEIVGDYYFAKDLPAWPAPLRVADCGAYDGDTIRYMVAHGLPLEVVYAFEPDSVNFGKLSGYAAELFKRNGLSIVSLPMGVGSRYEQVYFDSGLDTGSKRVTGGTGDVTVLTVRLDQVLAGSPPNLIKMDIEGGELEALQGCENILAAGHSPGFAVSIYHKPEDLWVLPEKIFELTKDKAYTFHIRCHCICTTDLVFYAVPKH